MAANTVSVPSMATCPICSKFFDDPRILPCLHSFCYECLLKTYEKDKIVNYFCPTCRADFALPNGGLSALTQDLRKVFEVEVAEFEYKIESQTRFSCDRCSDTSDNIAVTYCGTCHEFLCSHCKKDHLRCKQTLKHKLLEFGGKNLNKELLKTIPHKVSNCTIHSDEVLKFYCKSCSQLICRDCVILSHQKHEYDRIEQVSDEEKSKLKSLLDEIEKAATELESALSLGEAVIENIHKKKELVVSNIEEEFKKIQEAIEVRKKFLLAKTSELCFEKETALKLQQEPMSATRKEMKMLATRIEEALQVYTPAELLSAKSLMVVRLKTVKETFESLELEPCKTDYLASSFKSTTLLNEIENYAFIGAGAYPGNCTAALDTHEVIVGTENEVEVTAKDVAGNSVGHGGELVTAELSKIDSGELVVQGRVQDHNNGTYTISITPEAAGEHYLDIKIGKESIQSSPFVLKCRKKRDYTSLNILQTYSMTCQPYDVAENDNKLYVVHGSPNGITVIDKTTGASQTFNIGSVQLNSCFGIAVREGNIYVTDSGTHCVYKFTTDGRFLTKFGSYGSSAGQLSGPFSLCVSETLYVTERANQRISVFNLDGTFIRHIPIGEANPWGIAIDSFGNVHVVSYSINGNVTVFTPQGQHLEQYGQGQLHYPIGIAIDPDQNIVLIEHSASSSKIFSLKPQFHEVATFHMQANSYGVCLDKDGFIYVCDAKNNRVLKY